VADRFVAAARGMQRDGWWWSDPAATNRSIKRRILREIVRHRWSSIRGRVQSA
jgi:glutamate-1-semialdehyde 2,1-aminomutase